jgi:hypothetical protein
MDVVDKRIEVLEQRLAMFKRGGKIFTTACIVSIMLGGALADKYPDSPMLGLLAYWLIVILGGLAAICWFGALVTWFTPPE